MSMERGRADEGEIYPAVGGWVSENSCMGDLVLFTGEGAGVSGKNSE